VTRPKSAFVQLLEAVHEIEGLGTNPLYLAASERLRRRFDRGLRAPAETLRERAHSRPKRQRPRPETHAPRLHARKISRHHREIAPCQTGIGITTDIIVGFPGETEKDFEETLSLAREVEFDNAYIFKYSPRRDTPAAEMPDQVPQKSARNGTSALLETINEIGARKYENFIGRQTQILVEGPSKKNAARMSGRTRCNKIVLVRRRGTASRPDHGFENHARRFLHALRRPGDFGI
jgi:tRNA-2-methylthio-N6-dimethylallyladenosine synthase